MNDPTLGRWADSLVTQPRETHAAVIDDFDRVLGDAVDEAPLQVVLAANGSLLAPLAPPGGDFWCLDRPRLGAELIPDFLLASRTSEGLRWAMVELEGPNERVLTKAGLPATKLAQAFKQVRDWRSWLSDNVAYARTELGLEDIEASCPAYVIIGRRSHLDSNQIRIYRALSSGGMTVMSYDRLRDLMGRSAMNSEV